MVIVFDIVSLAFVLFSAGIFIFFINFYELVTEQRYDSFMCLFSAMSIPPHSILFSELTVWVSYIRLINYLSLCTLHVE